MTVPGRPLLHLAVWTALNRFRVALSKLRQPKYLVGLAAGAAYFWFVVALPLRNRDRLPAELDPGEAAAWGDVLVGGGALVLALIGAVAWLLPARRSPLAFTEAEVALLFPAPVRRRTLLHYKLIKLQVGTLLTVVVFAALAAAFRPSGLGGPGPLLALGWWMVLSTLQLHQIGAGLTRAWLADRGWSDGGRRAAVGLLAGLLAVGGIAWAVWAVPPPPDGWWMEIESIRDHLVRVLVDSPLGAVLAPVRLVVAPLFAPGLGAFFVAALPALAIGALHYLWVIRINVAFEEDAVRRAAEVERQREEIAALSTRGYGVKLKARPPPWRLAPTGRPEVALAWKNLTLLGWWGRPRHLVLVVLAAVLLGAAAGALLPTVPRAISISIATSFLGLSFLLGGQILRLDLRMDLVHVDLLKSLPLRGAELIRGELLASLIGLAAVQWALAGFVAGWLLGDETGRRFLLERSGWVLLAGALIVAPLINRLNLLLANGLLLLFPAWHAIGSDVQTAGAGIARVGQGVVQLILQAALALTVLGPAAAAGGVVGFWGAQALGHPAGWLLGVGPAALVLGSFSWFFADRVGEEFDAFDPAHELGR